MGTGSTRDGHWQHRNVVTHATDSTTSGEGGSARGNVAFVDTRETPLWQHAWKLSPWHMPERR